MLLRKITDISAFSAKTAWVSPFRKRKNLTFAPKME